METVIENPQPHNPKQQSQDEEAKQLFDDLSISDGNPFQNLQLSSQNHQSQPIEENAQDNDKEEVIDFRQMMRISKKQKKKEKKMRKIKQAKIRKQSRKQNRNENIKENQKSNHKPGKKMLLDSSEDEVEKQSKPEQQSQNLKIKKSSKKTIKNSDDQEKLPSDKSDDSDEYSSQNDESQDELGKMDPHSQEQGSGKKQFKKRLGKKSRKQRILEKQGFDLRELGNDAEANYELDESMDESDDSFSDGGRRKKGSKRVKKDKKQKKPKLTNEQFLGKLQELGREDQVDQNDADRYNYDSGLNELQKLRPKKESQNKIKIQNKLFGNFEMEIEDDNQQNQVQMPEEKLQLEIKPKSMTSSRAASFLNKVEALKKHRGLQADINQEEFDKITKEKAKRSISQLMTKIQKEVEENEEIDIEIKAPTIAKGKSADLINNTIFFVKNLSQKQSSTVSSADNAVANDAKNAANQQLSKPVEKPQQQKIIKPQQIPVVPLKSRKGVSRTQFFKQIKESINVRRSKYISDQELKNSMKASRLQELQQIRKKIEQKRRKDAMYEMGELEDDDADNVINELQADLARKRGVTVAEYRKLLREEEGIEGLEDYEEDLEKKKKNQVQEQKPQPKVVLELSIQQGINPNTQTIQKPSQPSSVEQQKLKKLLQLKKQLRIQKALAMQEGEGQKIQEQENDRHADDMIEQYQGVEDQPKDQMDLENQGDDEEDGDYEDEEMESDDQMKDQQGDQADQDDQANQEDQDEALSNKINQQAQMIKNEENPQVRKELQEQGIIMPGNKKKTLKDQQPELDFSKYMLENQNGQPIIPQSINQTAPKQSQKIDEQTLQFKQFKKLRKIAVVIQEKKKKRQEQLKRAKQFFQQQAELGSDNEQNDDNIKAINKKDDQEQEDGDELDQQLQELIDNAVDINEADQQQAFKKYMQDVKQKDREQLQRILRGDFRRPNQDMPEMQQMQQDQRNRIQRMERMVEWMKRRQQDENGMYARDEEQQIKYYYDKYGKKKRVEDKRNNNSQDDIEDSPEEDNGQLQKKLQFYLMDTISPAKKDTEIEINNDLLMELPTMTKKSTLSKLSTFNKKSQQLTSSSIAENSTAEKTKQTPSKSVFAGNLLSLAAPKGQSNLLPMPKMKKTSSHMSEVLNKNKSQKPAGFTGIGFKLPGLFNRLGKK